MFFDEKTAAIEIIQHGVRISTGGAIRLQNTPEQWDLIPVLVDRKVNKETKNIEVLTRYKEFNFDSRVIVTAFSVVIHILIFLLFLRWEHVRRKLPMAITEPILVLLPEE